jgi:hypothetical protein
MLSVLWSLLPCVLMKRLIVILPKSLVWLNELRDGKEQVLKFFGALWTRRNSVIYLSDSRTMVLMCHGFLNNIDR